jgi:hypothetical protein
MRCKDETGPSLMRSEINNFNHESTRMGGLKIVFCGFPLHSVLRMSTPK